MVRLGMSTVRLLWGAILMMWIAGCAPSMTPLYQDYEAGTGDVPERISAAFEDAGWELAEESLPPAIATVPRTHRNWGLYRVTLWVEAVPMGQDHVRLLIHPYREYVWGRRSKMPYLSSGIRRSLVADLDKAFAAHGFVVHRDR